MSSNGPSQWSVAFEALQKAGTCICRSISVEMAQYDNLQTIVLERPDIE
jgi:hypothetical protein